MQTLEVIHYLNRLYKSNYNIKSNKVEEKKPSFHDIKFMKKFINNNTKNFIFMAKISGPYCKSLEKEVSLNTKQLKKININDFSSLYFTWMKHGDITIKQHEKFNRAIIISVYKKGDIKNPANYRYLYNFSNNIKLLDKIWTFEICKELDGKINNNNFLSYYSKSTFNKNLKEMATRFTNSSENKILLDFKKAFDSVSFYTIETLLKSFLVRKLGKEKGTVYFNRYFNIIKNSTIYYEKIKLKRKRGIPTGLSSSNLVFTIIMEEIFYIYDRINPSFKKYFNFYVYVDDIAINVIDNNTNITKHLNILLDIFRYYKFECNYNKCIISSNIHQVMPQFQKITSSTKYLGIYFSRNQEEYLNLIIDEFNTKKNTNIKTISDMFKYNRKSAIGFLKYKLHPFL
tara:strand:+ start:2123 stop:3322 length:1200 start_codon:yes stop_codon:yes gene_type:complete